MKFRAMNLNNLIPVKPLESTQRLVDLLSPYADDYAIAQAPGLNQKLPDYASSEPHVLIVCKGGINIFRKSDSLLLGTSAAPALFGLQQSFFKFNTFSCISKTGNELKIIPLDLAISLIEKHQLWRDVMAYQGYIHDQQSYRDMVFVQNSTYEVICMLLIELERISLEQRSKIGVATYILERSLIARSGVMKILSALRTGGYIDMEKGKLIRINCEKFPDKF